MNILCFITQPNLITQTASTDPATSPFHINWQLIVHTATIHTSSGLALPTPIANIVPPSPRTSLALNKTNGQLSNGIVASL